MSDRNKINGRDLDNYITGHWGEDQFKVTAYKNRIELTDEREEPMSEGYIPEGGVWTRAETLRCRMSYRREANEYVLSPRQFGVLLETRAALLAALKDNHDYYRGENECAQDCESCALIEAVEK